MLVLRRKSQESIMIGDDIEITIMGIEGDQIKLGIDAPKNIEIHRKEIYVDIEEQNNAAADIDIASLQEMGIFHVKDKN